MFQLQQNKTSETTIRKNSENKLLQSILKILGSKSSVVTTHLNLNSACKLLILPKIVLVANTGQKNFQNSLGKTQRHLLPKLAERCRQKVIITQFHHCLGTSYLTQIKLLDET